MFIARYLHVPHENRQCHVYESVHHGRAQKVHKILNVSRSDTISYEKAVVVIGLHTHIAALTMRSLGRSKDFASFAVSVLVHLQIHILFSFLQHYIVFFAQRFVFRSKGGRRFIEQMFIVIVMVITKAIFRAAFAIPIFQLLLLFLLLLLVFLIFKFQNFFFIQLSRISFQIAHR